MRKVAIVTESFLPTMNGVANSVRHVADRLRATGHSVLIVAPGPGPAEYETPHGTVPVVRVRSLALPMYRSFPVGIPDRKAEEAVVDFAPDVVHLASPTVLGLTGLRAAERLGVPAVAVFQTDIAGFARQYGIPADAIVWAWLRWLHGRADRTLAPSSATATQLEQVGIPRVHRWGRGVDLALFNPRRRDETLRDILARNGEVIVGYVGRLAPEKQVHRLAALRDIPGVRLVVVGDGPARDQIAEAVPDARFLGFRTGVDLARAYAAFDIFVHTGEHETFCQTIQEAKASGLPVVAPAAGGPLDLVQPDRTGFLYAPGDIDGLRTAVSTLVGNPLLRTAMGRAARTDVMSRGWDSIVDELVGHYQAARAARAPEAVVA